jgi:hypothetical protein
MTAQQGERCEDCYYIEKSENEVNQFFCKRMPPISVPIPMNSPQGPSLGLHSVSPTVHPDNWCGEFEKAEESSEAEPDTEGD